MDCTDCTAWLTSGRAAEEQSGSGVVQCCLCHSVSRCVAWLVLVALACIACGVRDDNLSIPPASTATLGVTAASATLASTPTRAPTAAEMPTVAVVAPSPTLLPPTAISSATPIVPTTLPLPSATPGQPEVYVDSVEGNLDVFVRMADGTATNLTNHPSADAYPSLSPDGRQVLFVSNRDGPSHVFLISLEDLGLVRLTDSGYGDTQPQWAPDGQCIVYQTLLADHNWEIYSMRPDGSQKANLTSNTAIDVSPVWSPDGMRIAFETDRDGDFEIYVMALDGSNPTNVTRNPAAYDISPVWSADGERILFRSDRDGARFEYLWYSINPDGSDLQPVEE